MESAPQAGSQSCRICRLIGPESSADSDAVCKGFPRLCTTCK